METCDLPAYWPGLRERFGTFPCTHYDLTVGADFLNFIARSADKRNGEAVLAIRRPDGRLLLHTKPFYPQGTWRLPSGGIKPGETPEQAAYRELEEETGLPARLERLLGVLTYTFEYDGQRVAFASSLFLFISPDGEPAVQDPDEKISGYRWVWPSELALVATALRRLEPGWRDWGAWRALPHDFMAKALSNG